MDDKIIAIKNWLGSGTINIFGIQFSGKDTLAVPLAKKLGAVFISSGDLIRVAANSEHDQRLRQAAIDSQTGILTPTDEFRALIVPHLKDERLTGKPLVLGSVGRWIGEEEPGWPPYQSRNCTTYPRRGNLAALGNRQAHP